MLNNNNNNKQFIKIYMQRRVKEGLIHVFQRYKTFRKSSLWVMSLLTTYIKSTQGKDLKTRAGYQTTYVYVTPNMIAT